MSVRGTSSHLVSMTEEVRDARNESYCDTDNSISPCLAWVQSTFLPSPPGLASPARMLEIVHAYGNDLQER